MLLLASDLQPEHVGSLIAFGEGETVRGVLTSLDMRGDGIVLVAVDGHPHALVGDPLITVVTDTPAELRFMDEHTAAYERGRREGAFHRLMADLATGGRRGWDEWRNQW